MSKPQSSKTQLTTPVPSPRKQQTRRSFVQQSAQASLGLALFCAADASVFGQGLAQPAKTPDGYFAVPEEARRDPLTALKRASFTPHQGDFFTAANDYGQPVNLLLFKVEDLRTQRDALAKGALPAKEAAQWQEESFSLIFRGLPDEPLRQRTYKLTHHKLGKLEIFLTPVGKDEVAHYYEAVFNRSQR